MPTIKANSTCEQKKTDVFVVPCSGTAVFPWSHALSALCHDVRRCSVEPLQQQRAWLGSHLHRSGQSTHEPPPPPTNFEQRSTLRSNNKEMNGSKHSWCLRKDYQVSKTVLTQCDNYWSQPSVRDKINSVTRQKSTTKRVMSPSMRPREICSGPSSSCEGITYVVRAKLRTFAIANRMSDTISGSSWDQKNRSVKEN